MNKILAVSALAITVAFSGAALAKQNLGGGFTGPAASNLNVTAAEASKLSDDTPVILTGKIKQSLGDEKYMFRDASGTITVEIDNEDWRGVTVGPNDTVELQGEVDTDMFQPNKVDVDTVVKK